MEEMTQICLAVDAIDLAWTIFLNRREVVLPLGILHVHDAMFGEEHSVASVACRHDTVEHIDTSFDSFKDIGRSANTHEITRAVGR